MQRQKRVLEVTVPGHQHWLFLALVNVTPVIVGLFTFFVVSDFLNAILIDVAVAVVYVIGLVWPDKLVEEGPASVNVVTLIGVSIFLQGLMLMAGNWLFFLLVWPVHLASVVGNAYVNILYYREITKDKVV